MKMVIQLVSSASVSIEAPSIGGENVVSQIGQGLLVLVGLGTEDTVDCFDKAIKKVLNMRIFPDENGKIGRSVVDISGEILLVSQFTLYADCKKGNRPSFVKAMPPDEARVLYSAFVERFRELYGRARVKDGVFGAEMKVALVNDGPITILCEI